MKGRAMGQLEAGTEGVFGRGRHPGAEAHDGSKRRRCHITMSACRYNGSSGKKMRGNSLCGHEIR